VGLILSSVLSGTLSTIVINTQEDTEEIPRIQLEKGMDYFVIFMNYNLKSHLWPQE